MTQKVRDLRKMVEEADKVYRTIQKSAEKNPTRKISAEDANLFAGVHYQRAIAHLLLEIVEDRRGIGI